MQFCVSGMESDTRVPSPNQLHNFTVRKRTRDHNMFVDISILDGQNIFEGWVNPRAQLCWLCAPCGHAINRFCDFRHTRCHAWLGLASLVAWPRLFALLSTTQTVDESKCVHGCNLNLVRIIVRLFCALMLLEHMPHVYSRRLVFMIPRTTHILRTNQNFNKATLNCRVNWV